MKQHITIKQLNELSEKGKERLREWWKPQDGDLTTYWDGRWKKFRDIWIVNLKGFEATGYDEEWMSPYERRKNDFPLLSIGQMIEYLDEHTDGHPVGWWGDWVFEPEEDDTAIYIGPNYEGELCDALWEAVKRVLEK